MTKQGRAIKQAAIDFGDRKTLPFTPCKRGYIPIIFGGGDDDNDDNDNDNDDKHQQQQQKRMVACSFHEKLRRKRLTKDKGKLRGGEVDPNMVFWSKAKAKKEYNTTSTSTAASTSTSTSTSIDDETENAADDESS